MSTLTIRTPDDRLGEVLRKESQRRGESINKLVVEILETALSTKQQKRRYTDLDALAGTWTEADYENFQKAVNSFSQVDSQDWA